MSRRAALGVKDPFFRTLLEHQQVRMTITLDVTPELEADIARQAAARGMEMNAYAATVLAGAIHAQEPTFDEQRARCRLANPRTSGRCQSWRSDNPAIDR